jgi:hypothetical protein
MKLTIVDLLEICLFPHDVTAVCKGIIPHNPLSADQEVHVRTYNRGDRGFGSDEGEQAI